jgi:hypothetical protein
MEKSRYGIRDVEIQIQDPEELPGSATLDRAGLFGQAIVSS